MNPIIEKVAQCACEAGNHKWPDTDGYNDRAEKRAWIIIARAAIRATLEHVRDNVSEGMRGQGALWIDGNRDSEADDCFRAMLSQAIAELDA